MRAKLSRRHPSILLHRVVIVQMRKVHKRINRNQNVSRLCLAIHHPEVALGTVRINISFSHDMFLNVPRLTQVHQSRLTTHIKFTKLISLRKNVQYC